MAQHRSYCRLCPALCGILVTTEGERVVDVVGDPDHPLSAGYTCPKGRSLPLLHHHPDRLDHPLVGRGAARERVGWDAWLDDLTERVRSIVDEHGPDAVGMYVGTGSAFDGAGRSTTRRFMRALGSRSYYTSGSIDAPCKPLVAELVAGHPALMPHVDERARMALLIGINPVVSHGHLQAFPNPRRRLRSMAEQGELWVVDPRSTETARMATRHVAPRPGTDHAWLAAVVRELLATTDRAELEARATGVDALEAAVAPWTLERAAEVCDVPAQDLVDLVEAIRRAGRLGAETGTGMTMTTAANAAQWLLWALLVVTDSLDQPGGMWFNPGFLHSFDRAGLVATDGRPRPGPTSRPELPERFGELPSAAIVDEIEAGALRALVVVGGNLVPALPDADRTAAALAALDVLVVSDVVATATTDLATHVLPTAGQLERADLPWMDTITPAIAAQYTPAVVAPVAERRPVWWALGRVAAGLGLDALSGGDPDDTSDDDVLALMTRRARAEFADLREHPGPMIDHEVPFGWVREGVVPDGRWRLAPPDLVGALAALEAPPAPLVLSPSRQLRHLNSLFADEPVDDGRQDTPGVLLHPDDAAAAGVADGARVRVRTATGELVGRARVTDRIRRGAVSVPHGYDDTNVNVLTSAATLDPLTGMPTYSGVPVELGAVDEVVAGG